ncbi:hypothetical protein [Radiobacillus sp. PE A8.2]|uniref:hypothetical protein n=1 Tax=Radiobacillus sp. PE A8.2 TaxID=3380349 RepID=UPI00388EFE9D
MAKEKHWNRYPFIFISVIHTSLLIYTFIKCKDRKRLFILLLTNTSMAYHFEYFVLNLFQSYQYKPKFFNNKIFDNIAGSILSQALLIPFTAVYITAFQLNWKIKILFSIYFGLIEMFFKKIKIYKQYWWKTTYTVILLPMYFMFSDAWYKRLNTNNQYVQFISLYHMILVMYVNNLFVFALTRKIRFGFGKLHTWTEHFKLAPLYAIYKTLCFTWLVRSKSKRSSVIALGASILADYGLTKFKIIKANKYVRPILFMNPIILGFAYWFKKMVGERK